MINTVLSENKKLQQRLTKVEYSLSEVERLRNENQEKDKLIRTL
jgi:hypothetical protein